MKAMKAMKAMKVAKLKTMSDDELLKALARVCLGTRALLVRMLKYLGEVEHRMLFAKAAYPSMFDFCTRELGMSEYEAYLRLAGARLLRRIPGLLPWLESGRLHLTALVQLRELWTADNVDELAQAVAGKSKHEVACELARRRPRPDIPDAIRKLPTRFEPTSLESSAAAGESVVSSTQPTQPTQPTPASDARDARDAASAVAGASGLAVAGGSAQHTSHSVLGAAVSETAAVSAQSALPLEASSDAQGSVAPPSRLPPAALVDAVKESPQPLEPPATRGSMQPLSAARFKIQFTASEGFRRKVEDARNMLRHRHPRGELETIFELALDDLIARLKKERFAETDRPQSKLRPASEAHVRAATRRKVVARDGLRCSYVSEDGRRCTSEGFLELDHAQARKKGGGSEAGNLRVYCRTHNAWAARQTYGSEFMERVVAVRAHLRSRRKLDAPIAASAVEMGAHLGQPKSNGEDVHLGQPKSNGEDVHLGQPKSTGENVHLGQPKSTGEDAHLGQPKSNVEDAHLGQPKSNGEDVHLGQPKSAAMRGAMPGPQSSREDLHAERSQLDTSSRDRGSSSGAMSTKRQAASDLQRGTRSIPPPPPSTS